MEEERGIEVREGERPRGPRRYGAASGHFASEGSPTEKPPPYDPSKE